IDEIYGFSPYLVSTCSIARNQLTTSKSIIYKERREKSGTDGNTDSTVGTAVAIARTGLKRRARRECQKGSESDARPTCYRRSEPSHRRGAAICRSAGPPDGGVDAELDRHWRLGAGRRHRADRRSASFRRGARDQVRDLCRAPRARRDDRRAPPRRVAARRAPPAPRARRRARSAAPRARTRTVDGGSR